MDFANTHFSFHRPLTDYSKVQAAISSVLRGSRAQLWRVPKYKLLNIGCGPKFLEGFVHIDYEWRPGVDLCWDVTRGIPFSDGRFSAIFTEHCLEHLYPRHALRVLRECHRILKPGGVLRVVVPDCEMYMDLYVRAKRGEAVIFPGMKEPSEVPIQLVNAVFREWGHQYAYDAQAICALLNEAGFSNAERAEFGVSRHSHLCGIDSAERRCESLYVEAWD